MKLLVDKITEIVGEAFNEAGYGEASCRVTHSNRPDLCEFQCNGAMAGAKLYKKAPIMIANDVVAKLSDRAEFSEVSAVNPGFINIRLSGEFLALYLTQMRADKVFGCNREEVPVKLVMDYGGPNVAKPLHVGHLRSAVIGECLKRLNRFYGNDVTADVHLGDWGLQMGLIIEELKNRKPDLVYFDDNFTGEYPAEAPFTLNELEEIYPAASAKSKVDEEFAKRAHDATVYMQQGKPGYTAIWKHILALSIPDLKRNYMNLDVSFDVWKGESDAKPYIEPMIEDMKAKGLAYESQGALIMDVKEDTDTKEIPPCLLQKSDGAALYHTTDLATLIQRMKDYKPDRVLYVVDKRQEMHFTQVFRAARKAGIVPESTRLSFIGFGTMNGKDGKPFKTREGGVMRLETLISDINSSVYEKSLESNHMGDEDNREDTCKKISLAALKYGDLSNQASKDYVFDLDRFASFDGNTGPYILYNIVRIKTILSKYVQGGGDMSDVNTIFAPYTDAQRSLMLCLTTFNEVMDQAYAEDAPHRICGLVYDLANAFNAFYNETKILAEEDEGKKTSYINLIVMVKDCLEKAINILGFDAPERM
ncbi:MAG: arginine--tRNA ligase [Lachnospiraceae bacterium]|nr:arginine--tRNA ligase [Lachnospiraceae bacterium]